MMLASLTNANGDTGAVGRLWDDSPRLKALAWGTVWVLIALAPRFVMRIPEVLNEHQMYLPMVGISFTLGALLRPGQVAD
jgi:hypothetical protein